VRAPALARVGVLVLLVLVQALLGQGQVRALGQAPVQLQPAVPLW